MKKPPPHDHSETRLSCIECSEPVCPKCMVQCAVGQRCYKCTGGPASPATDLTKMTLLKVSAMSFASSLLIFMAQVVVASTIPVCFVSQLAACAVAYMLGGFIHKVSGYKDATTLAPWILIPLLIGFAINPLGSPLGYILFSLFGAPDFDLGTVLNLTYTPLLSVFLIMVPMNARSR